MFNYKKGIIGNALLVGTLIGLFTDYLYVWSSIGLVLGVVLEKYKKSENEQQDELQRRSSSS